MHAIFSLELHCLLDQIIVDIINLKGGTFPSTVPRFELYPNSDWMILTGQLVPETFFCLVWEMEDVVFRVLEFERCILEDGGLVNGHEGVRDGVKELDFPVSVDNVDEGDIVCFLQLDGQYSKGTLVLPTSDNKRFSCLLDRQPLGKSPLLSSRNDRYHYQLSLISLAPRERSITFG